jgi:hypothetical protein
VFRRRSEVPVADVDSELVPVDVAADFENVRIQPTPVTAAEEPEPVLDELDEGVTLLVPEPTDATDEPVSSDEPWEAPTGRDEAPVDEGVTLVADEPEPVAAQPAVTSGADAAEGDESEPAEVATAAVEEPPAPSDEPEPEPVGFGRDEHVAEERVDARPIEPVPHEPRRRDRRHERGPAQPAAAHGRDADTGVKVEDLFARIRASRAESLARAQQVLEEAELEGGGSPVAVDAPPAAEPPVEVDAGSELRVEPESVLDRRDAILEDIEHQLSRHLKRVLADEQNEALDLLRRTSASSIDGVLPDLEEHTIRYAEAADADLQEAARAGVRFFSDDAEVAVDVSDLAFELSAALVGQLRDRFQRGFVDAAGDQDEITDLIRSCYREWKTQRIAEASRHYVVAAFTRGVYVAQPEGTPLCWVVDNDGVPCPDAEDNALAGEVVKGEPFPTGHTYPPAHPGCRCLVVPAHK